jgi:hypothetical protein
MVSFGHTAIGVIVGTSTYHFLGDGNLITGLLVTGAVGVLSHYIADSIPHGHFPMPGGFRKGVIPIIIFDLFLSIVLFLSIIFLKKGFGDQFLYILFGIGGSQLPDVLDGLIYARFLKSGGLLAVEHGFHLLSHWHDKSGKPLPITLKDVWQVFVVLAALAGIIY